MRLTIPLSYPRLWIYMRGRSWYRHKKRSIVNDANLERIISQGYNVHDANEYVKPMSPLHVDYEELIQPEPRFPEPPKNDRKNPDWHDEICKVFDDSVFPIEGLQQALAFTKSVRLTDNLPDKILERADSFKLDEQEDNLAKRIVQQAFLWDSYLDKLPKLKNLDYPWWEPRREYGIPWRRTNEILMHNFIRLIESKTPASTVLSRMICPAEELRVNCQRHGAKVQFKVTALSHIMSTGLMQPVLSAAEVENTRQLPLTDIYPFFSTANFEESNVYKDSDHFAVKPTSKFPNIHTSIFSHTIPGSHTHIHPRWNDDRFMGTTVLYNFATALLLAKRKYGPDVSGDLPEPITTQVIHLTGKEFQFSVFQLNTVNLEDVASTTVKNNVWITAKQNLFSEIINDYGKEIFEGYNPEIIKTVAAMYLS